LSAFSDKDKGWRDLMKRFEVHAGETHGFAGYLRSSGDYQPKNQPNGKSNSEHKPIRIAALAAVHEFGATIKNAFGRGINVTIPERSYIRSAIDGNRQELEKMTKKLANAVLVGKIKSRAQAIGLLCEKVTTLIRSKIDEGVPPPNKPSTIARKGSSHTLIDTGQLRNSLDWEIREGKEK